MYFKSETRNGSQVEESRHDAYNNLYVYDTSHNGNTEELGGRTMVSLKFIHYISTGWQKLCECMKGLHRKV